MTKSKTRQLFPLAEMYREGERAYVDLMLSGKIGPAAAQTFDEISKLRKSHMQDLSEVSRKLKVHLKHFFRKSEKPFQEVLEYADNPLKKQHDWIADAVAAANKKLREKEYENHAEVDKALKKALRNRVFEELHARLTKPPMYLLAPGGALAAANYICPNPSVATLTAFFGASVCLGAANSALNIYKKFSKELAQYDSKKIKLTKVLFDEAAAASLNKDEYSLLVRIIQADLRRELLTGADSWQKTVRKIIKNAEKYQSLIPKEKLLQQLKQDNQGLSETEALQIFFEAFRSLIDEATNLEQTTDSLAGLKADFEKTFTKISANLEKWAVAEKNYGETITLDSQPIRQAIFELLGSTAFKQLSSVSERSFAKVSKTLEDGTEVVGVVALDAAQTQAAPSLIGQQWFAHVEDAGLFSGALPYFIATRQDGLKAILDNTGRNVSGWQPEITKLSSGARRRFKTRLLDSQEAEMYLIKLHKNPASPGIFLNEDKPVYQFRVLCDASEPAESWQLQPISDFIDITESVKSTLRNDGCAALEGAEILGNDIGSRIELGLELENIQDFDTILIKVLKAFAQHDSEIITDQSRDNEFQRIQHNLEQYCRIPTSQIWKQYQLLERAQKLASADPETRETLQKEQLDADQAEKTFQEFSEAFRDLPSTEQLALIRRSLQQDPTELGIFLHFAPAFFSDVTAHRELREIFSLVDPQEMSAFLCEYVEAVFFTEELLTHEDVLQRQQASAELLELLTSDQRHEFLLNLIPHLAYRCSEGEWPYTNFDRLAQPALNPASIANFILQNPAYLTQEFLDSKESSALDSIRHAASVYRFPKQFLKTYRHFEPSETTVADVASFVLAVGDAVSEEEAAQLFRNAEQPLDFRVAVKLYADTKKKIANLERAYQDSSSRPALLPLLERILELPEVRAVEARIHELGKSPENWLTRFLEVPAEHSGSSFGRLARDFFIDSVTEPTETRLSKTRTEVVRR